MAEMTHELLEEVVAGYIAAIFFTETGEPDQCPKDASFGSYDEALHDVRTFCVANADLVLAAVDQPGYSPQRVGNDLWLSRNGHGAGFFDRDELNVHSPRAQNPQTARDVRLLGEDLQEAANKEGPVYTDYEVHHLSNTATLFIS